ncbi:MAG: hypothetical protein JO048_09225, partial [Methylobacteriaceae bacterium]|nr:hypothetical protein [Methylobacteriaceae bacterium]
VALIAASTIVRAIAIYAAAKPEGMAFNLDLLWATPLLPVALGAVLLAWLIRGAPCPPALPALGAALVLAVLALRIADGRTASLRDAEQGRPQSALQALLPPGPEPILWIGQGQLAWFLAGRADWVSYSQGAGMVFSRPLAVAWERRMARAREAGLVTERERRLWQRDDRVEVLSPSREQLARFCAAPDAPAAIVAPLGDSLVIPAGTSFTVWTPPHPFDSVHADLAAPWRRVSAFAVIPCRQAARAADESVVAPGG